MNEFTPWLSKLAIWPILTSLALSLLSCSNVRNVRNFNQKKIFKEIQVRSASNVNQNNQPDKIGNLTGLPEVSNIITDSTQNITQWREKNENFQSHVSYLLDELESLKQEVKNLSEIILQLRVELNNSVRFPDTITGLESEKNIANKNGEKKSKYVENKLSNKVWSEKGSTKNNKKVDVNNTDQNSEVKYDKFSNSSQENKEFVAVLEDILNGIKTKKFTESLSKLHNLRSKVNNNSYQNSLIDYWIGEVYYLTKDYENALSYFRKASEIGNSPKRDKANLMIAECLSRLGKINEAKKAYQKFIQDHPFSEYISRAKKMIQQL